jgi:hypothetical protein
MAINRNLDARQTASIDDPEAKKFRRRMQRNGAHVQLSTSLHSSTAGLLGYERDRAGWKADDGKHVVD